MQNAISALKSNYPLCVTNYQHKVKGIFGRSILNATHVEITYNKGRDLFDIYCYKMNTSKSIEPTNEKRVDGVFVEDLKKEIALLVK